MSHHAFQAALDAFQQAETPGDLSAVFREYSVSRGAFGYVGTSHLAGDRSDILLYTSLPEIFGGLDETGAWWDDDPLIDRIDTGQLSSFGFDEELPKASPYAAMRFDVMRESGLGRGRVIPTSGGGFFGGVLLFAENVSDAETELKASEDQLRPLSVLLQGFLTSFAHSNEPDGDVVIRSGSAIARRIAGRPSALTQGVSLTPRERDCLTWVALGKSAEEISVILGLSVHTVRFHLRGAMARLETRTQAQAVAVAMREKLIDI